MKKTTGLLFFLFLYIPAMYSQIAGYMGKRSIVGYTQYYFPSSGPTTYKRGMGFNFTHVVNAEYLVKPFKGIGVAAQYTRTAVDYQYSYYNGLYIFEGDRDVPAKLTNLGFSLFYKRYTEKKLAPLGFYMKMELLYTKYFLNYDPDDFYEKGYYSTKTKMNGGVGHISFDGFGGAFSVGKQRVFFDKLILDLGFRASLMMPFPKNFGTIMESTMHSEASWRYFGNQLLSLKVGLGFLAF